MRAPRPREAVYRAYWEFAANRQAIFEARVTGQPAPWTDDEILQSYRFCNVFRAADRVSQHLIQHAAYGDRDLAEEDYFLRVVLHRLFSRPSTWELLERELGPIRASSFDAQRYGDVLDEAQARGARLYTGAFILCANSAFGYDKKHRNHMALISGMLRADVPRVIARSRSLRGVYDELRRWPLLGPFMAYQLAIDLNYSPLIAFSEDEFTVPGPGALRGLQKVFLSLGDHSPSSAIHWLVEQQHQVPNDLMLAQPTLFGRALHAIDCQNLLCEVDKYCRAKFPRLKSSRQRIKQRFVPDHSAYPLFFPPDWGINARLPALRGHRVSDPASV